MVLHNFMLPTCGCIDRNDDTNLKPPGAVDYERFWTLAHPGSYVSLEHPHEIRRTSIERDFGG